MRDTPQSHARLGGLFYILVACVLVDLMWENENIISSSNPPNARTVFKSKGACSCHVHSPTFLLGAYDLKTNPYVDRKVRMLWHFAVRGALCMSLRLVHVFAPCVSLCTLCMSLRRVLRSYFWKSKSLFQHFQPRFMMLSLVGCRICYRAK